MRTRVVSSIGLVLLLAAVAYANTAVEPVPRDERWVARHEGFLAEAQKGGIDVLFMGDSITDFWRNRGREIWEREYGSLKVANFGISGDRTQHVLWRLRNGEAEGYQPKAIVLMIGTNNTGFERNSDTPRNTTPEIIEGVTTVVEDLRSNFPDAKILLLAIFPRAERNSARRAQVVAVNASIAKLHDGSHIHYLDIGEKFLDAEGDIPLDVMPDLLHPNAKGYQIWADAIREPLRALLD